MENLPRPDLTEWHFGIYKLTKRQDQCTFDLWTLALCRWRFLGAFETYEGAVLGMLAVEKEV